LWVRLKGDVRPGQRDALDGVGAVREFGTFRFQELAAGRGVKYSRASRRRYRPQAAGSGSARVAAQLPGVAAPRSRLVSVSRATEATEASASPRKPSVPTRSRSSSVAIFDVA
jgi:hypothetical protein